VTVRPHPLLTIIDRNTTRTLRNQLALLARFPLSVIWLMWTIAGFRADVVHTNGGVAISPAFAAKLLRRPHVWHVREFFLEFPRLWPRYERLMFVMSDAIVAVSEAIRNQFSERARSKVRVVYDGLPRGVRRNGRTETCAVRERFGPQRLSACVIGRLKWAQGPGGVHSRGGAPEVEAPDAVIWSSARPRRERGHVDRFRALAHEVGVGDRVVFTGDIGMSAGLRVGRRVGGAVGGRAVRLHRDRVDGHGHAGGRQRRGGHRRADRGRSDRYLFAPGDERGSGRARRLFMTSSCAARSRQRAAAVPRQFELEKVTAIICACSERPPRANGAARQPRRSDREMKVLLVSHAFSPAGLEPGLGGTGVVFARARIWDSHPEFRADVESWLNRRPNEPAHRLAEGDRLGSTKGGRRRPHYLRWLKRAE
jgi:hypothetical protein